jgi:hypothetical protein
MLTTLMQSVIRSLPKSLCLAGGIHGRTRGCKGSLLKVKEEKYKREHGGHRWGLLTERASLLRVLLKFTLIHGKRGTR